MNLSNCNQAAVVDPAMTAAGLFWTTREDFHRFLSAELDPTQAVVTQARQTLEAARPGSKARLKAESTLACPHISETLAQEDDWGAAFEAALSLAVATVPTTLEGIAALAKLIEHQAEQGAGADIVQTGLRSLAKGIANVSRNPLVA